LLDERRKKMSEQKEPPPQQPPPKDTQKDERNMTADEQAEIKRKAAARARELLLIEKSLPKE